MLLARFPQVLILALTVQAGWLLALAAAAEPETTVFARFHTEEGNATGNAPIQVNGPGYEISGKGWHWDANRSRIQIKANVKAVFSEELDNLFK